MGLSWLGAVSLTVCIFSWLTVDRVEEAVAASVRSDFSAEISAKFQASSKCTARGIHGCSSALSIIDPAKCCRATMDSSLQFISKFKVEEKWDKNNMVYADTTVTLAIARATIVSDIHPLLSLILLLVYACFAIIIFYYVYLF